MKYKVQKREFDGRVWTHGILIPDGFYRVMQMTRHNHRNILSMEARGYMVTECDDDESLCGIYEENSDRRCTDESVYKVMGAKPNGINADAKLVYVTKGMNYVDPTLTLGRRARDIREEARLKKIGQEAKQSRESGLREAAAVMGLGADDPIGDVENALRAKLGS